MEGWVWSLKAALKLTPGLGRGGLQLVCEQQPLLTEVKENASGIVSGDKQCLHCFALFDGA